MVARVAQKFQGLVFLWSAVDWHPMVLRSKPFRAGTRLGVGYSSPWGWGGVLRSLDVNVFLAGGWRTLRPNGRGPDVLVPYQKARCPLLLRKSADVLAGCPGPSGLGLLSTAPRARSPDRSTAARIGRGAARRAANAT